MITRPNVKLNLGLRVLRRREDGYHDLDTVFLPYGGICDTLEIIAGDDYSRTSASLFARYGEGQVAQGVSEDGSLMVTVARAEGVDWDPLKDLTARAYSLLAADFQLPPAKIFLEKTAPVGAGLGGGSADGAFALRMLDGLFSLGLDDAALADYAARLGSDCPFFVYNVPMAGRGRGEVLTPLPAALTERLPVACGGRSEALTVQVVVPEGVSVSTAEAYRGIVPDDPGQSLETVLSHPVEEWKDLLVNDFEKTVFVRHPELSAIKASLYASGALYAAMSGSGSALFAFYPAGKA